MLCCCSPRENGRSRCTSDPHRCASMSFSRTIPHERLRTEAVDFFTAFICLIHHPEEFEVCEANGELFVRPRADSRSKAKAPTPMHGENSGHY